MYRRSFVARAKEPYRSIIVGGVIGLLGALGMLSGALQSWSYFASDRLFLDETPNSEIVIVAIDDQSINQVGRWPWDRSVHAELIRLIADSGARVIGYDVNFPESQDAKNDADLSAAIREAGNVVLPQELVLTLTSSTLSFDATRIQAPIPPIRDVARGIGHTNTPPDIDNVVRRIPISVRDANGEQSIQAFSLVVAQEAEPTYSLQGAEIDAYGQMIIRFPGPPQTFPHVSAVDVLSKRIDLSLFKGKIVFVGSTAPNLHDERMVPTSRGVPMSGVEVHASFAHTLLTRAWLQAIPSWMNVIAFIMLGLTIGFFVSFLRARWNIPLIIVLWMSILVAALLAFDVGIIVDTVWPTIVILFAFAGATIERRITAERERKRITNVFSRYVSPSVVDSILQDPTKLNLGGERRRMTVFFSDIRGFTSMSEGMQPEELVRVLNTYLDRMTDIVFEYDGVLDKYIGDAVMAFWNAPFHQPNHALLAVRTALAMKRALAEMNASGVFGDHEFKIGMGINTGEMVVGNTGGKVHTDYTVIGDSVNLASRLESLTKEYGVHILTTQATVDELRGEVLVRKLDKVTVKGKKEPVTIYEIVALMSDAEIEDKSFVRSFEVSLDDYFGKRFDIALEKCMAFLDTHPDDRPTQLLCERSKAFLEHPPAEDWDGTWVFTKK